MLAFDILYRLFYYKGGDMLVKRCPFCGSKNVKSMIYGLPTFEAMESAKRGEIVLEGCHVESNSPIHLCSHCNREFGSLDKLPLLGFKSFEFFLGGYFRPSHFIFINGDRKKKVIKYGFSADGRFIDIKKSIPAELACLEDIKIKQIEFNHEQWCSFLKDIEKLKIEFWDEKYIDPEILDGTQWHLEINYGERRKVFRSGSNAYPLRWKEYLNILKKYLNQNIE